MSNIGELLAQVQTSIAGKSRGETSYDEKHGLVLYYYSLFKIHGQAQYLELMRVQLKKIIIELLSGNAPSHCILSFPIIANLFEEELVDEDLNAYITLLDRYLFNKAAFLLNNNNTSFLGGPLGIVCYLAERLPNRPIEVYLRTLLPLLYEAVEMQYTLNGSRGTVSLGLPDGLSGVLLVLLKCFERGLQEENIKRIVRAKMLQIISYQLEVDFSKKSYSIFPDAINVRDADVIYSNKLCWRTGDLHKCLIFYEAQQLFEDPALYKIGDLVGLNTLLRKSRSATSITNSHFSQGSAGLAQTYRVLFNKTQNHSYREGYDFWIRQTVAFLGDELVSGFHHHKELDVLDGLVGVALTLHSYQYPDHGNWSHCLLL